MNNKTNIFHNLTNIASDDCINYIKHVWPNKENSSSIYYAQIPAIYKHKNKYHILYADRDSQINKSFTKYAIFDEEFNLIKSIDKPFYKPDRVGFFDSDGAMPSQFIELNNKLYLTFNGWNALSNCYLNAVGLIEIAFENDEMIFVNVSPTPFLGRNIDNPSSAVVPWITYDNDLFHVIYIGTNEWVNVNGKNEPLYYLKYANGKNLESIRTKNHQIIQDIEKNEVYSRPSYFTIDEYQILSFSSRLINDFRDGENSYRIQFAISKKGDYENWERKNFVFLPNLDWCNKQTCYSHFLENKNEILMFFNGNSFGKSGFGVVSFDKIKFLKVLLDGKE